MTINQPCWETFPLWNGSKTQVKHPHFTLPFDLELHLFPVNLMLLGHPKHFKMRANDEIKLTESDLIIFE